MSGRRLAGVGLVGLGVLLMALGLLFLVGAGGQAQRYAIGAVALALGAVAAGFGLRFVRQAEAARPERLREQILALAKERAGELSADDLTAALGPLARLGEEELQRMARDGNVVDERRDDGRRFYVFADLQPRLTLRRCAFCRKEIALEAETTTCPHCGGAVERHVERVSLTDDDAYHMDD